eukprot:4022141-Prorocentrum_lima.AAC.1
MRMWSRSSLAGRPSVSEASHLPTWMPGRSTVPSSWNRLARACQRVLWVLSNCTPGSVMPLSSLKTW